MSAFFRNPAYDDPAIIVACGAYVYPSLTGNRPQEMPRDPYTAGLARLRARDEVAIDWFGRFLDRQLVEGITVTVVPPSSPRTSIATGIARVAISIVKAGRHDGVGCLVRRRAVPPLGGDGSGRTLKTHLDTIEVHGAETFRGRPVLLLDDLMATGNSITACAQLLREAGAGDVQRLVLARWEPATVHTASSRSTGQGLEPKKRPPTFKPYKGGAPYPSSERQPTGPTREVPGRPSSRRLVVDDAPGPKYEEMLRKFGRADR